MWRAGLPIAVGAATAAQLRADGSVAVAFFGDGAVAQGAFHEAVNLAAVWRLPVIFFCENNGYAEFSPAATQHAAPLERRAAGYGVDYVAVDGNDVVATAAAMDDGGRGDPGRRGPDRRGSRHLPVARSLRRRPAAVPVARGGPASGRPVTRSLVARAPAPSGGHRRRRAQALESSVAAQLDEAVEAARRLGGPAAATLTDFVVRPRPAHRRAAGPAGRRPGVPHHGRRSAPRSRRSSPSDDRVFVAGIDVGAGGNVFGLTRGLRDRFGDRVRDTPISETAIVGLGVGAAMAGMRPVVELMYLDFIGVCLDQLLNQAAKLPFMTGGAAEMALTVRTQFGAGRSSGSQHSQSLEALLAHIPGLTVVMPSTPADTYGLLRAAIQDPNPVVFIENRLLYGMKGPQPPPDHILPIGRSAVVRPGNRRHGRVGLADGPRGGRRGRASGRRGHLGRGDRPANRRPARHGADPRLGAQDEPAADRPRGGRAVRHRRRDRRHRRPRGLLGPRRADPTDRCRATPPPYAPELEQAWLPDRDDIADAIRAPRAAS